MTAVLFWHDQMREAPKLTHDGDGLTIIQLGERVVVFPSEADTRFFFEAYTAVPSLTAEVAQLRQRIDEDVYETTRARCLALETENAGLRNRQVELEVQLAALAEKEARSVKRARVLAQALKAGIKP